MVQHTQDKVGIAFSTVACFKMCIKRLEISISELLNNKVIEDVSEIKGITFMSKVKGTGPDFTDAYRCILSFRDSDD